MRVPLSWLRDFAPVEADAAAVAAALDDLGLVVEGVERVGEGLDRVTVARVLATRAHPDADRVQLVDVDAGDGAVVQVVCGAFNFGAGDLVPLAAPGSALPDGRTIERRKVRGRWSEGMLCSARELGLSDDHSGILVLPAGAPLGAGLGAALGIRPDLVFDLDITPNRPDAMSIVGVARDLAARLQVPFSPPDPPLPSAGGDEPPLTLEAPDLCPGFFAQVLEGVTVGPSPDWLASRLTLAGMRPINNVVDVSNYVMLELGHPNHPYDRAKLAGGGLLVRRARPGETLLTLDEVERRLQPDDCVICDARGGPVGIGGIMGGATTEIDGSTATVLLEVAYFDPMSIARSSKRLGLRTEASARFERGVDPEGLGRAVARFCALAADVAGARAGGRAAVEPQVPARPVVRVRTARVNAILGTSLSDDAVRGYLEPIGFACRPEDGGFRVSIPSWRPDSEAEIDVIEEVGRHHGYARVARTMPPVTRVGALTPYQRERRRVRDVLAGLGLSEAWTTSLVAPSDLERAGLDPERAVTLANPLAKEESALRTSMLPGLLRALAVNASARAVDPALFEVGHVFVRAADPWADLPEERECLAAALAGRDAPAASRVWQALTGALRMADVALEPGTAPGLHPSRTARARAGGMDVGVVGEVDPGVLSAHDLTGRVGWLEVDLDLLLGAGRRSPLYRPISRFPSTDIDLAFEVDEAVPAAGVEATLRHAGGDLLVSVHLFDVFRGGPVPPGRRSLAYRLRFNALDRTLTDEEVADERARCIAAVEAAHGARLRA